MSSDLLLYFYHPTQLEKPLGKQAQVKKLSELHTRLEAWRKNLPKELEPREGQLPACLVMQYVQVNFFLTVARCIQSVIPWKPIFRDLISPLLSPIDSI